ncbi:FAD-dependent oxidoreductase [Cryptosporangium arvum]|uniref:Succinate dehydrogenase/fumarate reductase flavoprotein subunit n=1 Tax=Cryptosporangium arvum DSM 44712 TaxID=927661 RepID=A0A010ZWM5_9ACTN|nr:FAD-binding protein [Cryptosporangium arvum]EXG81622.1 succinate dehydrogenase/fumarate reductase flavoprotein subunit [Cryptosporangium arvum DSM 44712]
MSADGPDLVVVGAGGGLFAALRAAERGLSVLVVEASPHYRRGNNTSMCTAMVPGVGTRWQRAAGIEDSVELFVDDVRRKTGGAGDERLARALAEVSAELVEWMADTAGFEMSLMTDMNYPGHSVERCHTIPERHGAALVDRLTRLADASELIDVLVPARVTDVLLDDDGAARAVVAGDEEIPTRAVLLATNGFGADRDLVREHLPEIAAATYHGSETSRGDALRIGTGLGADTAFLDAYQGHAALSAKASTLLGWATIVHGGIMLDATGRRFGRETSGYSEFGPALAARPGATGWIVYDQGVHDECLPFTDFRHCVEAGAELRASSPEELADVTGLPVEGVRSELAEIERLDGKPDRFGRTFTRALRAPYAAVRVLPALFHTQGGLVVDGRARVLRPDGGTIPGLYASGGAAAGISGHGAAGYLAGNGLLPAFGLAYLAADAVADERAAR